MAEGRSLGAEHTDSLICTDEPSPLYFFYDCETTGLSRYTDKITEVAAVLYTKNLETQLSHGQIQELYHAGGDHFQSLCHCTQPLSPIAAQMTGLTLDDLQDKPPLQAVLKKLLDWIRGKITKANSYSAVQYFFDFPFFMIEIEQCNLYSLLTQLDVHFADTLTACRKLTKYDPLLSALRKHLKLESLYTQFFPNEPYEGHRALADARMLHKLFTDTQLAGKLDVLRSTIKPVGTVRR